ncbi:MAG: extracellular solute-binding protein [Ruminococcaceae bacterium]|nr:extracellular solute-binding protein [Oscillospiraceae bacterium]
MKNATRKFYIFLVFFFLYAPIGVLIVNSFNQSKSRSVWGGFTLDWYSKLIHDEMILKSLATTLIVALIASIISTILGTAAAIGIFNMKKNWRSVVLDVSYLPIINPEIVTGVSLMVLFAFFALEKGYLTLILAHISFCVPYVILNVLPKLRQMDKHLIEAALDLGCDRWQAFRKITLPEIMPGVITGFLMSFTYSVDDFVISYFTHGATSQTLSVTIYSMTRKKVSPKINALSTLIFVVVLAVLIVVNIADARKYSTKKKKSSSPKKLKKILIPAVCILCAMTLVIGSVAFFTRDKDDDESKQNGSADASFEFSDSVDWNKFRNKNVVLNVYNWGEYISVDEGEEGDFDTIAQFEKLTGIDVNYSTFASNEELYAKLSTAGADAYSYDVIIPSDYMVGRLINEGMLAELDYTNIPNIEWIGEKYLDISSDSFDPGNKYSVPYTWGYVGIIYNTEMVDPEDDVETWDILWNKKYEKDILMFNNSRDAFAISLFRNGCSVNDFTEEELEDAADELKKQKPLVQSYVMDEIFDKMGGGEAALAPYYAGDAVTMMEDNEDLAFAVPKEGTNLFIDSMCIPKGSQNKEAAEMFINFMCETQTALANIEYICYSTPHMGAYKELDEDIQKDPIFYPDFEASGTVTESFEPLPNNITKKVDSLWTDIMTNTGTSPWLTPIFIVAALGITLFINIRRMRKKKQKEL